MQTKSLYSFIFVILALGWAWSEFRTPSSAVAVALAQQATPTPLGDTGVAAPSPVPTTNQDDVLWQQLTDDKTASFHPTWSPDGRRIAFHRRIDGWKHIFTMKADGSDLKQLTTGESANFNPAWSRNNRIAFVCNRNQSEQICVINADGSGFTQLTAGDRGNDQPTWSPDSRWLAFVRACSIYIMDADGANVMQLVQGSEFRCSSWPAWSPDGANIAFRYGSASGGAIYVLDVDGNMRQLTDAAGNNRKPTWSPDGKQIAFERDGQIFLINADGTGIRELTPVGSTGNRYPDWSPKENLIAFERQTGSDLTYRDTLYQIYVVSVTATGRQMIDPLPTVEAPVQPRILPQSLLGKTFADPELADYLLNNRCSLQGMHYVCKAIGVELSLTTAQRVRTVFFYAEGADGFKQYQDELPYDLVWSDTRLDVERKLGPPTSVNEGLGNQIWVSYDSLNLSITYQSADSTAQLRDLRVSQRR